MSDDTTIGGLSKAAYLVFRGWTSPIVDVTGEQAKARIDSWIASYFGGPRTRRHVYVPLVSWNVHESTPKP